MRRSGMAAHLRDSQHTSPPNQGMNASANAAGAFFVGEHTSIWQTGDPHNPISVLELPYRQKVRHPHQRRALPYAGIF